MKRRDFLKTLAGGAAVVATPAVLLVEPEPVRRYWQVPANAPVTAPRDVIGELMRAGEEYRELILLGNDPVSRFRREVARRLPGARVEESADAAAFEVCMAKGDVYVRAPVAYEAVISAPENAAQFATESARETWAATCRTPRIVAIDRDAKRVTFG